MPNYKLLVENDINQVLEIVSNAIQELRHTREKSILEMEELDLPDEMLWHARIEVKTLLAVENMVRLFKFNETPT